MGLVVGIREAKFGEPVVSQNIIKMQNFLLHVFAPYAALESVEVLTNRQ